MVFFSFYLSGNPALLHLCVIVVKSGYVLRPLLFLGLGLRLSHSSFLFLSSFSPLSPRLPLCTPRRTHFVMFYP
jgi:hypothetical protein